jgi:transposase-like protein
MTPSMLTPTAHAGVLDPLMRLADAEGRTRPTRRRFSAPYKVRILREADACTMSGQLGALLRREGLYSSHLAAWRKQHDDGAFDALNRSRGRKPADPAAAELARLRRENAQLQRRLEVAETIIAVQKKVSALLGLSLDDAESER